MFLYGSRNKQGLVFIFNGIVFVREMGMFIARYEPSFSMYFVTARAMPQTVRRRPLTTEARLRCQFPRDLWLTKLELGQVFFFLQILRFSHICIIPLVFHAHIHLHVALTIR